jgi:hypothetical protein
MGKKKISILVTIISMIAVLIIGMAGCAKSGSEEPDYSKAIIEDFLVAFSNNDYDSISSMLSSNFKTSLKSLKDSTNKEYASDKEAFIDKISNPIKEKIGEYKKGTAVFEKTLTEKGYTSVFYQAEYSKETQGKVTIQLVFEEENGKSLIGGLWFNSKTLQ